MTVNTTALRIGICGYGGLGRLHAGNLAAMDDVTIAAVCDCDPAKLTPETIATNLGAAAQGFTPDSCHTYTDYHDMLRQASLDAVVAALPTDLHAPFAVAALDAGVHVFSEKPMALDLAGCDAMIEAARRNTRVLQIGQVLRFWTEYEALAAMVRDKRYGPLVALTMERLSGAPGWGSGAGGRSWFLDHTRSGGALLDLHMHDVDWCSYALGTPSSIYAAGSSGPSGGIDEVTAVWTYAGGPVVTIRGSWRSTGFAMRFAATFEDAVVSFGYGAGAGLVVQSRDTPEPVTLAETTGPNAYVTEIRYFIDRIGHKTSGSRCTPESTRMSIARVQDEVAVIRSGTVVRL